MDSQDWGEGWGGAEIRSIYMLIQLGTNLSGSCTQLRAQRHVSRDRVAAALRSRIILPPDKDPKTETLDNLLRL